MPTSSPIRSAASRAGAADRAASTSARTVLASRPARPGRGDAVIYRMWHGWTTPDNADAYEKFLVDKLMPDLMDRTGKNKPRDAVVLRRVTGTTFEFVTLM